MSYDCRTEMKSDLLNAIGEWFENNREFDVESDELFDEMYEDFWVDDSVTGNASGSYTFNRAEAEDYVKDNLELCIEAYTEFGFGVDGFGKAVWEGRWEDIDVTVRCYLLGEVLAEALEEYKGN